MNHIFEVVDATDDERYYTLGLFETEPLAMAVLDGASPPYNDDDPESVKVEVRRRPFGFHPHAWDKIAERTWQRNYADDAPAWTAQPVKLFSATAVGGSKKPEPAAPGEHPNAAVRSLLRGSPHGQLTRAGTFSIREEEATGFVVSCSREQLAALPRLPMYREVVIVERSVLLDAEQIAENYRDLLQRMLDVSENCDETGYADGVGFVDIDKLHAEVRAAVEQNGPEATGKELSRHTTCVTEVALTPSQRLKENALEPLATGSESQSSYTWCDDEFPTKDKVEEAIANSVAQQLTQSEGAGEVQSGDQRFYIRVTAVLVPIPGS